MLIRQKSLKTCSWPFLVACSRRSRELNSHSYRHSNTSLSSVIVVASHFQGMLISDGPSMRQWLRSKELTLTRTCTVSLVWKNSFSSGLMLSKGPGPICAAIYNEWRISRAPFSWLRCFSDLRGQRPSITSKLWLTSPDSWTHPDPSQSSWTK